MASYELYDLKLEKYRRLENCHELAILPGVKLVFEKLWEPETLYAVYHYLQDAIKRVEETNLTVGVKKTEE